AAGVPADDARTRPGRIVEVDDLPLPREDAARGLGDGGLLTGHHVVGVQWDPLVLGVGHRVVDLVVHHPRAAVVDHALDGGDHFGRDLAGCIHARPEHDQPVLTDAAGGTAPDLHVATARGDPVHPLVVQDRAEQIGEIGAPLGPRLPPRLAAVQVRHGPGTGPHRLGHVVVADRAGVVRIIGERRRAEPREPGVGVVLPQLGPVVALSGLAPRTAVQGAVLAHGEPVHEPEVLDRWTTETFGLRLTGLPAVQRRALVGADVDVE